MDIKNWWAVKTSWLKGGILGVILILIYFVLSSALVKYYPSSPDLLSAPLAPLVISSFALDIFFNIPIDIQGTPKIGTLSVIVDVISFAILLASYFLIGALIGWVAGKIKIKKIIHLSFI